MVYVLTSNGNILRVDVRSLEARENESSLSVNLSLPLKKKLSQEVFSEQQQYLESASKAAYTSLKSSEQVNRFKASVNLLSEIDDNLNFIKGSSSSGLGYTLGLFNAFWTDVLKKGKGFRQPVFATGEVHNNCEINTIGHLNTKIEGMLNFCIEKHISSFYICIPKENKEELHPKIIESIIQAGGEIIAKRSVQETLLALLGEEYDGNALGRWEPFKGLKHFEFQDKSRFFGRDDDVRRLFTDLNVNNGFLIVSGPTGAGKSSLIKAGLIPYLQEKNSCDGWISFTPYDLETHSLIDRVINLFVQGQELDALNVRALGLVIREQDISEMTKVFSDLRVFSRSYFIHIDQFEEIFTSPNLDFIWDDLKLLKTLLSLSNDIKIVLSLRNEYLPNLLETGLIQSPVISNVSNVLSPASWSEIIVKQAKESNVDFESNPQENLQQLLIDEAIKTPNALAMVQYVLTQLYESSQAESENRNTLRLKHFHEMGGIAGAIATRAEQALTDAQTTDELVSQLFSVFVNVNSDGIPFARTIECQDNNHESLDIHRVLADLYKANILLKETNDQGIELYKIAHESLFENWPRLQEWIEQRKEFLIWKNAIDKLFQEWKVKPEADKYMYLLSDIQMISEGVSYKKQSLIHDSKLLEFLKASQSRKKQHQLFNSIAVSFIVVSTLAVIPSFSYNIPQFEVNTKTCDTNGLSDQVLEISVSSQFQANDLAKQFCHGNNQDIASKYGKVKFSWATLDDSYDLEKLFSGELAVVQSSESSLVAANIISNQKLYTPIAKYSDYNACLFAAKGQSTPELTPEYFEGKTLGLNNKTYSISGYQVPYLSLLEKGIQPKITGYPGHSALKKALSDGEVDLIGTFCEYKKDSEYPNIILRYNSKLNSEKITGTTWYVSNNIKVEGFKCLMLENIERWSQEADPDKYLYFKEVEILSKEGCE